MEQCKNQFGTLVSDYWKDDFWVNLLRVDLNLAELAKCLNTCYLKHEDDVFIWKENPSGMYSTLLAYANSFEDHDVPCWAMAWVKDMTPKVNIFFWILLQNKILTLDNLNKMKFLIVNRCALCENDEESMDHIMLHCPYTKLVWDKIWSLMNVDWVSQTTIQLSFLVGRLLPRTL